MSDALALAIFSRPERTRGPLLAAALLAVCLHTGLLFGVRSSKPYILEPKAVAHQGVEISLETIPEITAPALPPAIPPAVAAPAQQPSVPVSVRQPAPDPVLKPVPTLRPITPKPTPTPPSRPTPQPSTAEESLVGESAAAAPSRLQTGPATVMPSETGPTNSPQRIAPSPLGNPKPAYPDLARNRGQEGRVLLRVAVDAAGAVERITVEGSSGYSLLDQAAQNAVKQWHFSPARLAGAPMAGEVLVPVEFRLQ